MSNDFNPYSQFGQQPPSHGQPGYGQSYGPPPPPRSSRLWAYIIAAVVVLFGGLSCACCGGLGFAGKSMLEQDVINALRDHPTVREHLGEIRNVTYNLVATSAHEDEDSEVYDIVGDQGSGELTAWFDDDHEFLHGSLRLENGDTYELP
jgi:hypothetical protein